MQLTKDTNLPARQQSKRFVKKQQMRWTQRGAHLLLQIRVQVLNDNLRKTFGRWFPRMREEEQAALKKAA